MLCAPVSRVCREARQKNLLAVSQTGRRNVVLRRRCSRSRQGGSEKHAEQQKQKGKVTEVFFHNLDHLGQVVIQLSAHRMLGQ